MGEPKKETVQKWTSQQVSQWIFDRDPEFQNMLVDVLSCAFTVLIQFVCNHKLDSFPSNHPSADAFNYHNITGEILLELKESDFMKIVHDRVRCKEALSRADVVGST